MKLEIRELTKHFGPHKALSINHLLISNCLTLGVLGPSGSGKSTLLRLIAGLTFPDTGTVILNNQPILYQEKELQNYRKEIGIVFQGYNLFPHLTALENIVLPLQYVKGLSKEEARDTSINLLKRFDLLVHADKKPFALSGGQAQRVALIRAIAIQPKILLLDEPTSALDPLMTAEVLELIFELKHEKRDIMMVTHHLQFAQRACDYILFVAEGQVQESGPTKEIFENPQFSITKEYFKKVLFF